MLSKGGLFAEDHADFLDSVGVKALVSFFTAKAGRRGLRLLPYAAVGIVALLTLIHLASNRLSDHGYGSGSRILSWRPGAGYEHKSGDGGMRIVVFGGGDVATLGKAAGKGSHQNSSWTEVLCKELGCSSHLSYLPQISDKGGSLISNSLYDVALNRTIYHPDYELGNGEGYRWLLDHHPVPAELPDLQQQMNAFLASPRPNAPFSETLWVFNFGFWDIWKLSSMPRKLAHDMMEQQVNYLFSQIEMLCQKARSPQSVAFSDSSTRGDEAASTEPQIEPFRIMIPRVFDPSLTPGFATARFHPPMPYSRAEEMRNAAWLTEQWDKMIDVAISEWIAFHPPIRQGAADVEPDATGAGKKAAPLKLARREAINVDAPKYLRWVIVDRQLRNLQVQDSKGLGTLPTEVGFQNVQDPCVSPWSPKDGSASKKPSGLGPNMSVCETPEEHLFWNEFTVNSRAINAIGKLARIRYVKHMSQSDPWLKKTQDRMPDLTTRNVEQQFKG